MPEKIEFDLTQEDIDFYIWIMNDTMKDSFMAFLGYVPLLLLNFFI